ncbi:hypothetical protein ACNKHW_00850 [Shigella flexneri]
MAGERSYPPPPYLPDRLATGANVYLASAELVAVASLLGRRPTRRSIRPLWIKWMRQRKRLIRYLNFDQLNQYTKIADGVIFQTAV